MKSATELLEQIIRAKTAPHLKLVAERRAGKGDVGVRAINNLIEEVNQGISSAERMLVYKNEIAAEIMSSSTAETIKAPESNAEAALGPPCVFGLLADEVRREPVSATGTFRTFNLH